LIIISQQNHQRGVQGAAEARTRRMLQSTELPTWDDTSAAALLLQLLAEPGVRCSSVHQSCRELMLGGQGVLHRQQLQVAHKVHTWVINALLWSTSGYGNILQMFMIYAVAALGNLLLLLPPAAAATGSACTAQTSQASSLAAPGSKQCSRRTADNLL
jgi:hypothetical protein